MAGTDAATMMTARPRLRAGRIAYRDGAGAEIGRERFEIIDHAGGHVLRAFCEMDDIGLLRDVTIALDADWRPVDGFCRVSKNGKVAASTWFAVGPQAVRVECVADGAGRLSQTLQTAGPLAYLGLHPLQGDAMIAEVRGEADPGVFVTVAAVTNSISPNGDEGLTGTHVTIDVAFIGHETVTVAAGTFAARRFALRWHPDWPTADLWVRAEDCVLVMLRWSMTENWFELAAIEE